MKDICIALLHKRTNIMNPVITPLKLSPAVYTLISTRVPCGFPSPAADYQNDPIDLNAALVKNPSSTFFFRAEGDSMAPLIGDDDLLLVDRSLKPKPGSIVLAVVDGEYTVKRYTVEQLRPVLVPINKKYSPIRMEEFTEFYVWGVVARVIKDATV